MGRTKTENKISGGGRKKARPVKIEHYGVKQYQYDCLKTLLPPEDITVSEWAEKYRVLDRTSVSPGPWRNNLTPYLKEIMDELNNYESEEIVFCKPSQVGGTEALLNMLGWVIQFDLSPTLLVYPSDTLGKQVSAKRIEPMIKASKPLRDKYRENESSLLELVFTDGSVRITGAGSPSSLASNPIKNLFLDEVDKFPGATSKEADALSLAKERTKTFYNKKIFTTSTPTIAEGNIWRALNNCDVIKHYYVPCPHCGKEIELLFKQIEFPDNTDLGYTDRAELAVYRCQECGHIIEDRHKPQMLSAGRWKEFERHSARNRAVGYWLNSLYAPFLQWRDIAREWLKSQGDPEMLQNFVNSWLAEPWEDTKVKTNADVVLERQTDLPELWLPEWTKLLTAGVDVQETSLYYTIRAWGDMLTSQNIAHGQVTSFGMIEDIMNRYYSMPDGEERIVDLCLIDSGDDTDTVYELCIGREDWLLPSKGSSQSMWTNYKISKINAQNSKAKGMQLVIIDTDKYKDAIASRLKKENGPGSFMTYSGCDREYAEQLTAEHKVTIRRNGRKTAKWVKKQGHGDNHYLDCEVYAFAAADICGVRELHLRDAEKKKPVNKPETVSQEEQWITENELKGWM